jgi:hypothetical protein
VHSIKINGQLRPVYSCGASSCTGSLTVGPSATTTYTLTSVNAAGTPYPSLTATVTVSAPLTPHPPPPPPPPTPARTITAHPAGVLPGQSSVLSFTTTTADVHSIKINGLRPVSSCDASSCTGSLTVSPSATTTYTLTSVNAAGTPYPALTVTVTVSAP